MTATDPITFLKHNRRLIAKTLGHHPSSIELVHGRESLDCRYYLRCTKSNDFIFIDIYSKASNCRVPFDQQNQNHRELLDHLWWMVRDYGHGNEQAAKKSLLH